MVGLLWFGARVRRDKVRQFDNMVIGTMQVGGKMI